MSSLYYCHEAERQTQKLVEEYPVVVLVVKSESFAEVEEHGLVVGLVDLLDVVRLQVDTLAANCGDGVLSYVDLTVRVVEDFAGISLGKGTDFNVFYHVPEHDSLFSGSKLSHYRYFCGERSRNDALNCVLFLFRVELELQS